MLQKISQNVDEFCDCGKTHSLYVHFSCITVEKILRMKTFLSIHEASFPKEVEFGVLFHSCRWSDCTVRYRFETEVHVRVLFENYSSSGGLVVLNLVTDEMKELLGGFSSRLSDAFRSDLVPYRTQ